MINFLKKYLRNSFLVVCLIFGFLFSLISILRFDHFMTGSYDLSIYDQAIWLYSRFSAPISTVREINVLGDHFSPILILLSPLFWIWNDVKILLIFQSLLVCLSVNYIYKILVKWLEDSLSALFISLTFFLFLGLQYAIDYDFHLVSLSVFPLSLIFYGLFLNKKVIYWIGIIVSFLLKEDLPIIVFFVGLYEFFILRKRRLGIATMLVSIFSFFLITKVLMPSFQDNSLAVKNYIDFYDIGDSPTEMIRNTFFKPWIILEVVSNSPIKIRTFLLTLKSFAFIPLFSPLFWIISFPIWMERLLSSTPARWQFEQYYGISLTPILVLACGQSILYLKKILGKFKINSKKIVLFFSIFIFGFTLVLNKIYNAPLTRLVHLEYYRLSETEKSLKEMIKLIPPNSSVSAQQPIVAHISHRKQIFWFPKKINEVEYIALVKGRPATPIFDSELNNILNQLIQEVNTEIIFNKNDVYLFKKNIKLK